MTKIDDHSFFDLLFQQFTKTTRAEDTYWMTYEVPDKGSWSVHAADKDDVRTIIATNLSEVDADFITAVHGCMPDLVRRLHAALDEADRADREHDEREQQIGRLSMENQELREESSTKSQHLASAQGVIQELHQSVLDLCNERDDLQRQLETQRSKAADVLWKIERPM